jgi:hypothetical protein
VQHNGDFDSVKSVITQEWGESETSLAHIEFVSFIEVLESFLECCIVHKVFSVGKFALLCNYVGMSFEDLYKMYLGKNVLNKFRQENGYREGTYHKIWNRKEDNEVLSHILTCGVNIDLDHLEKFLHEYLTSEYAKVLGGWHAN